MAKYRAFPNPINFPRTALRIKNPPPRPVGKQIGLGLNFQEILNRVPLEPDNRNATHVRVYRLNKNEYKAPNGGKRIVITAITITRAYEDSPHIPHPVIKPVNKKIKIPENLRPRLHRQRIEFLIPNYNGNFTRQDKQGNFPKLILECDCKRWVFMWEYAMWRKRAARVRRGNGQPPFKTNPEMRATCCKHLFRVLLVMRSKRW